MKTEFSNILIVRTDRIGDVILTTPAIEALRKSYPNSKISILVSPQTKELVIGNPNLDEVIVDDRNNLHKGFLGFLKMIFLVRSKKFDLAILYHTKKRTNALCFFAGIPYRIGYRNNKFGFLLTYQIKDVRHHGLKHEAEYCLDVLREIGIDTHEINLYLPLQKEAKEWVEGMFRRSELSLQDNLIAIHPGASCPTKIWPMKRFAELIDQLNMKYPSKVIIVGHSDVRNLADELKSMTKAPVVDLVGQTTISQLVSLLKKCAILISNDSGPVHIAAALGTPVVSIFTRNQPGINPERWRPLGERIMAVYPEKQEKISFVKGEKIDPSYLESIQTAKVLEAVDSIIKLC